MTFKRYTEEFRAEAVRQVKKHGYAIDDASKSLYKWVRDADTPQEDKTAQVEIARLKRELKRTEEERDILKKATVYFAKASGFTRPEQLLR